MKGLENDPSEVQPTVIQTSVTDIGEDDNDNAALSGTGPARHIRHAGQHDNLQITSPPRATFPGTLGDSHSFYGPYFTKVPPAPLAWLENLLTQTSSEQ